MSSHKIYTLDLNFQGKAHAIASYLIPYARGAVLVEVGPGSTLSTLVDALAAHGFSPRQVTDVLVTHIHLDHAGAAGWWGTQGAQVHVHPVGYPHLLNPEKLLASAARIYGDQMDRLWGEFLAVPSDRLVSHSDGEEISIGELVFQAVDTPGHAYHHFVYLFEDVCFTGDIGGIRIPGSNQLRIPMPPPEFHLEKWRESLERLRSLPFERLAPTHFGIYDDREAHLSALQAGLDEVETLMENIMPANPSVEELERLVVQWARERSARAGVDPNTLDALELANPTGMSAAGIHRYWKKFRQVDSA